MLQATRPLDRTQFRKLNGLKGQQCSKKVVGLPPRATLRSAIDVRIDGLTVADRGPRWAALPAFGLTTPFNPCGLFALR